MREIGRHMIKIEELLQKAMEKGASDVHIAVGKVPKMRHNGQLVNLAEEVFLAEDMEQMLQDLLNDKQKKCLKERGEAEFMFSALQIGRCRVNLFRQQENYAAAIRLFGIGIPKVEKISIPQNVLELCYETSGLVIISGASGSGKTTTAAVLLDQINQEVGGHILTLESLVEYLHIQKKAIVNQREIQAEDYSSALRAARRKDADVILVGEMRDAKTIEEMLLAAEMGHLVIGVMDAVGAVETIERMVELFSSEQQRRIRIRIGRALKAVISQQLIPTLRNGKRVGVFDFLSVNTAIKELICEGKVGQIETMMQNMEGMQIMDEEIFNLYVQGEIDRKQVLNYARDVGFLEKRLL